MKDPQLTLGGDLSQQYFGLRQNLPDTTYYPVFDLVYAVKPANIGTEELNAAMKQKQVNCSKFSLVNENQEKESAGFMPMTKGFLK